MIDVAVIGVSIFAAALAVHEKDRGTLRFGLAAWLVVFFFGVLA